MCGRFTLRTPTDILMEAFDVSEMPDFPLRYNIAPTTDIVGLRSAEGQREVAILRWGLVPFWAKEPTIGSRMINARSESVAEKPAFRNSFKKRRCLILADGYYEWQKVGAKKQPYLIHRADDRPFAMAGLWDTWSKSDPPLESCTIITTSANSITRNVHDRMPVILEEADLDAWLDPENKDEGFLQRLLVPNEQQPLRVDPVSTYVNSVRNQGPRCVEIQAPLES